MSWSTIKYNGQIDFATFICDEPILNEYLHQKAVKDQENELCSLYFLVNDKDIIGGFYVVSNGSIRRQNMPTAKTRKNLPGYPIGTVHIGRLARHKDMVGLRLGDRLILSALETATRSADIVAAHAITVDAKNLRAETYYIKHGFENLNSDPAKMAEYPKSMYMKMKDARFILKNPVA